MEAEQEERVKASKNATTSAPPSTALLYKRGGAGGASKPGTTAQQPAQGAEGEVNIDIAGMIEEKRRRLETRTKTLPLLSFPFLSSN